jgi:hypothetical protein
MLEMDDATELEAMGSTISTLEDATSDTGVKLMIDEDIVEEISLLMGAELEDSDAEALDPTSGVGEILEIVEEATSCAELGVMTLMMLKLMSLGLGDSFIDMELLVATLLSGTTTELPGLLSEPGAADVQTTSDDDVGVLCNWPAAFESLKPGLNDDKVADIKDIVKTCDNMGDVSSSSGPMSQSMDGILNALDSNDEYGVPCNRSLISESVDDVEEALDMAGELPSGRPMYQSLDNELDASGNLEA